MSGRPRLGEQAIKGAKECRRDLGASIKMTKQQCGCFERRQRLTARLAAYSAVTGLALRVEHEPAQL